jgi:DNA-binding NarL/FixJ family response regulator
MQAGRQGGPTTERLGLGQPGRAPDLDWTGRADGLTDRECEILALITQGRSNAEIASLSYLSPNTVKSYIRATYRKIGVRSGTQAVLWGVSHGFAPSGHRIEHWGNGG